MNLGTGITTGEIGGELRTPRCAGFIDIGTNSIRLLVVRIDPEGVPVTLARKKEAIRLGEGEFSSGTITQEAIDRCVTACSRFAAFARRLGAEEIVAVATSAMRDARNCAAILARLHAETGIHVRVISGREEARLIYLGVAGSTLLGSRQALFLDIGGGSVEIAVGSRHEYWYLASHPLGAIRLTGEFFPDRTKGPVPRKAYQSLEAHIRSVLEGTIRDCGKYRLDCAVGSSGTLVNIAEIAARRRGKTDQYSQLSVTHEEIRQITSHLASLPLVSRMEVPGINPDRADIIIAGAMVASVLMDSLAIPEMIVSQKSLQDGLLAEYIGQFGEDLLPRDHSVRQRGILHLLRMYDVNDEHTRKVADIACSLYDSCSEAGLLVPHSWEREMLLFGALLHDIGSFISYEDHHRHSAYIVSNSVLPGFSGEEIAVLATLVRYHRKRPPRMSSPEMNAIPRDLRKAVLRLCVLVRLAEALDHATGGLLSTATLGKDSGGDVLLRVAGPDPGFNTADTVVHQEKELFRKTFGKNLVPCRG